jgi:hypothetical protein
MMQISANGQTVEAQVVDEVCINFYVRWILLIYHEYLFQCPGCPDDGLDLSPALFERFGSDEQGVIYGSWVLEG